jgi:DNA-binding MarR family transcriptional regulator
MTDLAESATAGPETTGAGSTEPVEQIAESFVDLMRTFVRARQTIMQAAQHDVEWSAHVVIRCLKTHGPMRAGALADALDADPSTISRQVAAMVKDGLVQREADPEDGRASLLVLTPKGDSVMADHDRIRTGYFADMLGDWSASDLATFAGLLDRFSQSYRAASSSWVTAKIGAAAGRPPRTGSNA